MKKGLLLVLFFIVLFFSCYQPAYTGNDDADSPVPTILKSIELTPTTIDVSGDVTIKIDVSEHNGILCYRCNTIIFFGCHETSVLLWKDKVF